MKSLGTIATAGLTAALFFAAAPALAHTGAGTMHGFAAGFAHPLFGADHVLAMVAVGAWAALAGGRALWAWPAAFVAMMIAGALAGMTGAELPIMEAGIALSVLMLGLAVALRAPLHLAAGALVCGVFAVFHGFAHGAELPAGDGAATYVAGFALATALLHAAGLTIGLGLAHARTPWLPRLTGGAVAAAGLVMLVG